MSLDAPEKDTPRSHRQVRTKKKKSKRRVGPRVHSDRFKFGGIYRQALSNGVGLGHATLRRSRKANWPKSPTRRAAAPSRKPKNAPKPERSRPDRSTQTSEHKDILRSKSAMLLAHETSKEIHPFGLTAPSLPLRSKSAAELIGTQGHDCFSAEERALKQEDNGRGADKQSTPSPHILVSLSQTLMHQDIAKRRKSGGDDDLHHDTQATKPSSGGGAGGEKQIREAVSLSNAERVADMPDLTMNMSPDHDMRTTDVSKTVRSGLGNTSSTHLRQKQMSHRTQSLRLCALKQHAGEPSQLRMPAAFLSNAPTERLTLCALGDSKTSISVSSTDHRFTKQHVGAATRRFSIFSTVFHFRESKQAEMPVLFCMGCTGRYRTGHRAGKIHQIQLPEYEVSRHSNSRAGYN